MAEIQENKEVENSNWSDLLEDILTLIKSNLFARDYDVFSAVCRSWRSTPPPLDSRYRSSPCLMFINRENYMSIFFHPLYNYSYSMDIPELYNAYILSSNYGWLLISIDQYHIYFFNPFTREKIELPDLSQEYNSMSFTSPPTSDDCLIIGYSTLQTVLYVGMLRRGQQSWDAHSYETNENNEKFRSSGCNPVLFNKLYYVLGIAGNIGVFDPDKLTWNVFGTRYKPEVKSIGRSFFVESDGRLVVACLSRDCDNEIPFFSLDLTNMVWQPEQSIGDKTLYASCSSTFFKRAVDNAMSNKIYFPFYCGRKVVYYCLAARRFHSFDGDGSPIEKKMMREKCNAWIEPNYESVGYEKLIW